MWQKTHKIPQELTDKGPYGLAYSTLWIAGWKDDPLGWDKLFSKVETEEINQRELVELVNTIKKMMENQCLVQVK